MNFPKLVKALIKEIRELREQNNLLNQEVEELSWGVQNAESDAHYAQENASQQIRQAQYEAQETEDRAHYRQLERQSAVRDLERAKDWGDSWGQERAMRRIKNLR